MRCGPFEALCHLTFHVISDVRRPSVVTYANSRSVVFFTFALCQLFLMLYIAGRGLRWLKSAVCVSFVFTHVCATTHLLSDIMTFKLLHSKRANTEEGQPRQRGTTAEHPPSPPTQKKSKITLSFDRFDICIYKVTDHAGDCWSRFQGSDLPLWQVSM